MKFAKKDIQTKELQEGLTIDEYCKPDHPFPIDGAVAHFNNGECSWKTNKGFYELFYVIDGQLTIEHEDEKTMLEKGDMYIIEPDKKHRTFSDKADIFIVCNPPFDVNNVEW